VSLQEQSRGTLAVVGHNCWRPTGLGQIGQIGYQLGQLTINHYQIGQIGQLVNLQDLVVNG